MGGFDSKPDDPVPPGTQSVILLGPDGANFWPVLTAAPEYQGGKADAVDHWSNRTVNTLAQQLGGHALFPFGQAPPLPFISWALRTGQAHISDAHLLVDAKAGLWVSYRGALALPFSVTHPAPTPHPCATCQTKPCLAACPPRALTRAGYVIPACHAYLDTDDGQTCMTGGCVVRASCPVSQGFARPTEQSAHHMRYFHK